MTMPPGLPVPKPRIRVKAPSRPILTAEERSERLMQFVTKVVRDSVAGILAKQRRV